MSTPNNKSEQLQQEISRRAYQRYCDRGCTPGADVDDWLAAEREVLESQKGDAMPGRPTPSKPRRSRKAGQ